MAIYLKTDTEIKSIRDVIENMSAIRHNGDYDHWISPQTYYDPECTIVQCVTNRLRSFEDVLEACQTYFPETTEVDLMKELVKPIKINDKLRVFYGLYCRDIKKPTFLYQSEYRNYDENNKGRAKYSWQELYEMIGINNNEELSKIVYGE